MCSMSLLLNVGMHVRVLVMLACVRVSLAGLMPFVVANALTGITKEDLQKLEQEIRKLWTR